MQLILTDSRFAFPERFTIKKGPKPQVKVIEKNIRLTEFSSRSRRRLGHQQELFLSQVCQPQYIR
jgi:hypothetical protein